jgi:hypothetical protein
MGIDKKSLGLEMNEIPISGIEELLKSGRELAEEKETKKEKESTKA